MPAARGRRSAAPVLTPGLTPGQRAAATRRRNAEARRLQQEQEAASSPGARAPAAADRSVHFDLPRDADAPVLTGQLHQSLSHVTATMAATDDHVESISAKVDDLGSKLDALIARLDNPGLPSAPAVNRASELAADPAPLRGQHGECPPISRRYGYIDEKLRGEAMAGTMAPEKLPPLLPVGSALATRQGEDDDTFEVNGVTVTKKKVADQAAVLAKFVRGIPKPAAFAVAWGIYSDLLLHGMAAFDARSVADAHSALLSHATWILEHAENFTWESVMSYHLTVSNERKDGFTCGLWYKNYDGDPWGTIGIRKQPAATRANTAPTKGLSGPPSTIAGPSSLPSSSNRGRACVNWNAGVCTTTPCPNGYQHVCKRCQGPHVIRDCPKGRSD